jgi:hypothetical protein
MEILTPVLSLCSCWEVSEDNLEPSNRTNKVRMSLGSYKNYANVSASDTDVMLVGVILLVLLQ